MNDTMKKFSAEVNLIGQLSHWAVVLRPKQVTLGCLVLIEKSDATSIGELSPASAAELPQAVAEIERALKTLWAPEKFNYLALMMVDPNVHFHVIPRYASSKTFDGVTFVDDGWPKPPTLSAVTDITQESFDRLKETLRKELNF